MERRDPEEMGRGELVDEVNRLRAEVQEERKLRVRETNRLVERCTEARRLMNDVLDEVDATPDTLGEELSKRWVDWLEDDHRLGPEADLAREKAQKARYARRVKELEARLQTIENVARGRDFRVGLG